MAPQRNGLPPREPPKRLGTTPQLPAQPGGPAPYAPRHRTEAEVFPGPESPPTIKQASVETPPVRSLPGMPRIPAPTAAEDEEPILPVLNIPRSFDELVFFIALMTPAREVSVVVEQTIAPGASGSTTVSIPANVVDVAKRFREAGDVSVSYRIEVDGAGRTAVANHRLTGGEREFARYWEKYTSVIVSFTNNDPANAALLQLEWVSVQVNIAKWTQYRDLVRTWSRLLGVQE